MASKTYEDDQDRVASRIDDDPKETGYSITADTPTRHLVQDTRGLDRLISFNGINGTTGDYAMRARPVRQLGELMERRALWHRGVAKSLRFGLDPQDLRDAGWGVVSPADIDPGIREAMRPLLERRLEQATEKRFQELTYLPGETSLDFWRRHGVGPGVLDPERLPYYLLIVGDPDDVPFGIQRELGVPHAIGRLSFASVDEYAAYSRHLVDSEVQAATHRRVAALFGVENSGDTLTRLSVEHLVRPLRERLASRSTGWGVETYLRSTASKARLASLLSAKDGPSVLLTTSHGVRFGAADPRQGSHQGALLCADWPGPARWTGRALPDEHMFAAHDVATDARLDGLVALFLACHTAGTSRLDSFAEGGSGRPGIAAPQSFVARLPQRLLTRGALAVIGHVDLPMEQSLLWHEGDSQIEVLGSTLQSIMSGVPIGFAMNSFSHRFAQLSVLLASARSVRDYETDDDLRRFQLWAAYQDARSLILLGDPAARLNVGS